MMRAITLIRPWCWAIAHAGKDIENRTWRPPASVVGTRVAIHAGMKWDVAAEHWLRDLRVAMCGINPIPLPPTSDEWPGGRIVCTAVVHGTIQEASGSRWFAGPYGWMLRDVRVLPVPVQCRGGQGLRTLPEDVEARVRAQLGEIGL